MELSSSWSELQNWDPVEFQQNLLRKIWLSSSQLGAEPASQTGVSLTGSCEVICVSLHNLHTGETGLYCPLASFPLLLGALC